MGLLIAIAIIALIFLVSAIPLHLAASMLGGNSSLLKAALTNLIVGIAGAAIYLFLFKYAAIAYFIAVLLIYKSMFGIGWLRALLVWAIQGVIAFLLILLAVSLGLMVL